MSPNTHTNVEIALDTLAATRPGLVDDLATARSAQKQLFAELMELRRRYAQAHRDYCVAYAAVRGHGVRERVLTIVDCPPLDPRHDPFLREGFVGRRKPS